MVRKPTWILLGVFVVLIALAFFLQKNPQISAASATPSPTAQAQVLPGINSSDITGISLLENQKVVVQVARNAQGGWGFGEQGKESADAGKMEQARSQLAAAQVITTLPQGYALDALGLSQPSHTLIVETSSDRKFEIQVGNQTPTKNGYYVQLDKQAPIVVNNTTIDTVISLLQEATTPTPTPTSQTTPEGQLTTPAP